MIEAQQIEAMISDTLTDAKVQVRGDDGRHFEALVVDQSFEGLSQLQRHRLVYQALGDSVGGLIHALSIITKTPKEFDQTDS